MRPGWSSGRDATKAAVKMERWWMERPVAVPRQCLVLLALSNGLVKAAYLRQNDRTLRRDGDYSIHRRGCNFWVIYPIAG
jgi:hypothetical protein